MKNGTFNFVRKSRTTTLVAIGMLLTAAASDAQNHAQSRIEAFGALCRNDTKTINDRPFIDVEFTPVRLLRQGEQQQYGTWAYTYDTDNQKYANDRYILAKDTENRIDLVSILSPPNSDADIPPYLWHVISVPNSSGANQPDRLTGFMARHSKLWYSENEVWERQEYSYLQRSLLTLDNNDTILTHINSDLSGADIRPISQIWRDTFGEDAMEDLVITSSRTASYTHTFVYQDAPLTAAKINSAGDRRNSSRRVQEPGTAFGFVLDNNGTCLAWTRIKLVRGSSLAP